MKTHPKKTISYSELMFRIVEIQKKINEAQEEMAKLMKRLTEGDYGIRKE